MRNLVATLCLRGVRIRGRIPRGDAGMTTAEYAVGTLAACAFAAVLYKVVTSAAVLHALSRVVPSALNVHL